MKNHLYFNKQGMLKILQFTDIHYIDDNELDHKTRDLMERIIKEEKPDFIIITGDTVYGANNLYNLEKALTPILESNIPWSYTFGNHDTEHGLDYETLFNKITSLPNCYAYQVEGISGTGNHSIEVKDGQDKTKWILFGIDSGAYNQISNIGGYDYVKDDQCAWYKRVMASYQKTLSDFSSLVFMHIPLPEYNEVWDMEICCGEKNEEVCAPRINSGFFTTLLEAGNTKGVFVGHDHVNDYMGNLYGITLAYGRATGYNTYGKDDYPRGARVIVIDEKNTEDFHTYLHLEDGTIIKEQKIHQPHNVRHS